MNSFLEDIEFASKVNEEIKRAEQRGIDNSLELTKEMIKQQYGDIEKLQQENKQLKELTKDKSYCKECEFSKDSNVLIELEKWLKEEAKDNSGWDDSYDMKATAYQSVLDKIQELKEKYK